MPDETTTTAVTDAPAPATTTLPGPTTTFDPDWDEAPEPTTSTPAPAKTDTKPADAGDAGGAQKTDAEPQETAPDWLEAPILQYAKALGFTEDEARSFGNLPNLQKALTAHDRKLIELGRTTTAPTHKEPTETTTTAAPPPAEDDFVIDESALGPEIAAPLKAMKARFEKKLADVSQMHERTVSELRAKQQAFEKMQEAAVEQSDLQLIAGVIEGMGSEYVDVVKKSADPMKALKEIREAALALHNSYVQRGMNVTEAGRTAAQRAFYSVFADQIQEIARSKIAKASAERRKASSAPPSHRKPKPTGDPVQDAKAEVRAKLLEMGQPVDAQDNDDW